MTELEYAWDNAYSLRENPVEMLYIGTVTRCNTDFHFYRDKKGKYWYESGKSNNNREV